MKVAVIGTGYVGLVTGTCLAEKGNDVTCIDIDQTKVERMLRGEVPIYEPGLEELFKRNFDEGRLNFTTNIQSVSDKDVIFLALPTPPAEDGSADLSYMKQAAQQLGPHLKGYSVIVNKSTVPVGTTKIVGDVLAKCAKGKYDVVSNPEFLREGQAIADFMHPERVVIGTESDKARRVMEHLYYPFISDNNELQQIIFMSPASAEITKYAANALLATKISFINELSNLCIKVGADVGKVRLGVGSDARIGQQFLYPGPGYGGSCFPKDTLALLKTGEQNDIELGIVQAVVNANDRQKRVIPSMISEFYGTDNLKGRKFALWGLAFKDNTDDIRESPALVIIKELISRGATVVVFDPQAMENTRKSLGDTDQLGYAKDEYEALEGADALVIATNWAEFSAPDFDKVKNRLESPVIFDGRNMYDTGELRRAGFYYASIGRSSVDGRGE